MAMTHKDPVCGIELAPGTEAATSQYQGQTYYFCSMDCMHTFENDPEHYAEHQEQEKRG